MVVKRVCEGSVAVAGVEKHGDGMCMQRFCSGGRVGVTWKQNVYTRVL